MAKKFKVPVSIQVYLGSGKGAEQLRQNLLVSAGKRSISEYVVSLLLVAAPELFKGAKDGQK